MSRYSPDSTPDVRRWTVPGVCQGQMVEYAYGYDVDAAMEAGGIDLIRRYTEYDDEVTPEVDQAVRAYAASILKRDGARHLKHYGG